MGFVAELPDVGAEYVLRDGDGEEVGTMLTRSCTVVSVLWVRFLFHRLKVFVLRIEKQVQLPSWVRGWSLDLEWLGC